MTIITREGGETTVNTTTALGQIGPITVALANGQYLIAWTDGADLTAAAGPAQTANTDIRAQLYNADGTRAGGEFVVTNASGSQILRSVTQLSDGNLLFAWQTGLGVVTGADQTGSIFVQEFTTSGTAVSGVTQVGTPGTDAVYPAVSALANGGYVVTWTSGGSTPSILAQIYDAANAPVGSVITVDNTQVRPLDRPSILTLADGNFVIAWRNGPNEGSGATLRTFNAATGSAIGSTINAGFGTIFIPEIAQLANGNIAVAYASLGYAGPSTYGLLVDILDPMGGLVSRLTVDINASTVLSRLKIDNTADGGFVVTWMETEVNAPEGDGSGTSIRAAFFSESYQPVIVNMLEDIDFSNESYPFTVNSNGTGDQNNPSIAVLASGDIVISWVDDGAADGSQSSIQTQLFNVDPANRAPIALDGMAVLDQQGVPDFQHIRQDVLTQFAGDLDGDALTVTAVSNAQNGTVVLNSNGTISFTPNAGYTGPAIFDYTVSDGNGGTATARATLVETFVDRVTIRGATDVTINALANDYIAGLPPVPEGFTYEFALQRVQGSVIASYYSSGSNVGNVTIIPTSANVYNETGQIIQYRDLPVGQSDRALFSYTLTNSLTGQIVRQSTIEVTFEGWMTTGTPGADTLTGTEQADHLNGNGGADTLIGLGGDDYYTIWDTPATVIEAANGGIDTIRTNINIFLLPDNVENLNFSLGSGFAATGTGNALNNIITGDAGADRLDGGAGDDQLIGNAGNDTLYGNDGNDLLSGGTGADTMYGGAGDDRYLVDSMDDLVVELAGGGVDRITSTLASTTLSANVEDLYLSFARNFNGVIYAFNGTGNELDNRIYGNDNANVLYGMAGNDRIDGGLGADQLYGGDGDDVLIIDDAADVAEGGEGRDQVQSAVSHVLHATSEDIALSGTANINATGNAYGNIMAGNAGNNIIDGGIGLDYMTGGDGDDIFIVDETDDRVDGEGGRDIVHAYASFALTGSTEDIRLMGSANISAVGNAYGNVMVGNDGNNHLNGGLGADYMYGGAGDDVLHVDNADDVAEGGDGRDQVHAAVTHILHATTEDIALSGTANVNAYGNAYGNIMAGNAGNNIIDGGIGIDYMTGGDGDDIFIVDNSDDMVDGEGGRDIVHASVSYALTGSTEDIRLMGSDNIGAIGNGFGNVMYGNDGDNHLDGRAGIDFMYGGAGNDVLYVDTTDDVAEGGDGHDLVFSSVSYALSATTEDGALYGTTNINMLGNSGANGLYGSNGDNILWGLDGNDRLNGRAGNDTLYGGGGSDTFVFEAGTGSDTIGDFENGTDRIDLSAFGLTYADLSQRFQQDGANVTIQLLSGETIVINNTQVGQLDASDFIL